MPTRVGVYSEILIALLYSTSMYTLLYSKILTTHLYSASMPIYNTELCYNAYISRPIYILSSMTIWQFQIISYFTDSGNLIKIH